MRRRPALATVLALPAILLGLAGNLATGSVQIEPWLRGWVWAGVAVLAVLVLLTETVVRRPAAQRDDAAEALARAVGTQWRREEIQRRVHDPFPLQITWRPAGAELVDHPLNVTRTLPGHRAPTLELTGRLEEVAAVYRGIPSGRLVVFGKAGAGKTILALRLVLDLLGGREPGGRVPVLFGIAQWDPVEQPLEDWMAGQLARDYPGLAGQAAELVAGGTVLPVLDGFDELAEERRLPALEALNGTTTPLLLTTRPEEYLAAVAEARPVSWAAGIELAALDVEDLAGYLPRTGKAGAWEPVLQRMRARPDGPLAAALDTPLLVALARTVYSDGRDRDPAELEGFATAEDVRRHLFGAFLPAAYGTRGARWGYRRARSWLGYLACHGRVVAWWDLAARVPDRTRRNVLAVAFGAGFGLLSQSWLAFGFAALLGLGLASADLDRVLVRGATATPLSVLAAHRKGTLIVMAMGSVIFGLEFGVIDPVVNSGPFWDSAALGVLLVVATIMVCSPWGRWLVLARLWLPLSGRLPWALPAFLDDAYRRGVLRQTGAVYEFRHAHVMDYLVAAYAEERELAAERRTARGASLDRAFRFASARLGRLLLLVAAAAVATGSFMRPGWAVIGAIWLAVVGLVLLARARNTIDTWPDSAVVRVVGRDTAQVVLCLLMAVLLLVFGRLLGGLLGSRSMSATLVAPQARSAGEFLLLAVPLLLPALFTRAALGFAVPVLIAGALAVGEASPTWPLVACLAAGLALAWWSGTARLLAATSLSFLYGGPVALATLPLAVLAGAWPQDPLDTGLTLVPAAWEGFAVWAVTALAVALVVVALLRGDRIAAAVAATCFAGPPVWLVLVHHYAEDVPWLLAPCWVLGGAALSAVVLLRWWRHVPTLAYVPAAFADFPGGPLLTFAGVASIAAVVCAVPVTGVPWPPVVVVLALLCCVLPSLAGRALRGWARGSGGALVAGAALLGCALLIPAESRAPWTAVLAFGAVVVAAWHRHPVVAAAAAYLVIRVVAVALPGFEPPGALIVLVVAVAVPASLLALLGPAGAVARAQAAASVAVLAGVAALPQFGERIDGTVGRELMSRVSPSSLPGLADGLSVVGLVVLGLAALLAATAARGSSPLLVTAVVAAAVFGTMPIGYEPARVLAPWLIFGGLTAAALAVAVIVMVARRVSA